MQTECLNKSVPDNKKHTPDDMNKMFQYIKHKNLNTFVKCSGTQNVRTGTLL